MQQLHDDIAQHDLQSAVVAGTKAPRIYAALATEFLMQTRDASVFVLGPQALGEAPKPTDADLQKLYNEAGDRLRRPETRALTVVLFDPHKVAAENVTVDPAEVKKEFDFRKDSYATPEKRTFVQVSAKDAASATRIAQALRAGQTPDAAAKANGGQVVVQTNLAKTAVPDPKVAAAVFAQQPGQVSDPVQGELGVAVVKLTSVTPGRPASFEEKRPEIEAALRERLAKDKINDMLQQYSEARDGGASATDAAKKVGAIAKDMPLMTAEGQTLDGQPFNLAQPVMERVLSTGFALRKGGQSEPQQLGGAYAGIYFAVQVKEVRPPYKPAIAELRSELVQVWTGQETAKRLKAKGDELLARLRKGEPIDQVAASVHAQVQSIKDGMRPMQQGQDPRTIVLNVVFNAPVGQPFATQVAQAAFVIGKVDASHPPATVKAAELAAGPASAQISRSLAKEMWEGVRTAANTKIKPKVNTRNLNSALGLGADQQQQPVAPPQ